MNTNPAAKRILCFGDSNTWGYVPGTDHERYPSDIRWPGALQSMLGSRVEIIEEGLNSRGILKGDSRPGKEGRSSLEYIIPCLDSHDPIDVVIVFLGTNELKFEFGLSSREIGENLRTFLTAVTTHQSQNGVSKPAVIVIVPPRIDEETDYCRAHDKYKGASEKSTDLRLVYRQVVDEVGVRFLDAQDSLKTGTDGVHLLSESHRLLAEQLAKMISE
ncbi:MAG: hydrolase [Candidatus Moranbacteria bacterium]|nr:hydrolase [Candidatus Moranbacteria bacterium]